MRVKYRTTSVFGRVIHRGEWEADSDSDSDSDSDLDDLEQLEPNMEVSSTTSQADVLKFKPGRLLLVLLLVLSFYGFLSSFCGLWPRGSRGIFTCPFVGA